MVIANGAPLAIPVIDIADENRAANDLVDAASRYGFVFVKNSGADEISQKSISDMFSLVICT